MVSINYSSREVCCKIVYYGPGLSGKTTNLQYVHSKVPGNTRGDLISLATEADRTLYFDFLPINIGTINGFAAKFQLYTVPGQVYYNATRKLVLRGVDGVVFVADSQPDKLDENIESLMNLQENLEEYGYNLDEMPLVIQYNKRDLPGVMSVAQLEERLNPKGWPYYEAQPEVAAATPVMSAPTASTSRPYPTAEPEVTATSSPSASTEPSDPVATTPASPSYQEPSSVAAPKPEAAEPSPVDAQATPSAATESVESSKIPEPAAQSPDDSQPASSRPFPGNREESGAKKITPTAFTPTPKESSAEVSYEKNVLKNSSADTGAAPSGSSLPGMAPPLRRRSVSRKRGFFKRLFGIK
jgi:signal recognition particle receptor subunit beta